MKLAISDNLLQELSDYILLHTGLYFPQKKWRALNKGIKSAAHDLGLETQLLARQILLSPPEKYLDTLIGYLTIGETYFLRDKNLFQILGDKIIQGLINHPKKKKKTDQFLERGMCIRRGTLFYCHPH